MKYLILSLPLLFISINTSAQTCPAELIGSVNDTVIIGEKYKFKPIKNMETVQINISGAGATFKHEGKDKYLTTSAESDFYITMSRNGKSLGKPKKFYSKKK